MRHKELFRTMASFCLAATSWSLTIDNVTDARAAYKEQVADTRQVISAEPERGLPLSGKCHILHEAEACAQEYSDAHIALVNYSLTPRDAEYLADNAELLIEAATQDIIDVDIDIVPASNVAQADFRNVTKATEVTKGNSTRFMCVDTSDIANYSSHIADKHMPQLAQYDKVIGLTSYSSCEANVAGIAVMGGRHAEVFRASSMSEGTAIHELLHLFGLGHSSGIKWAKGKDWNTFWYKGSPETDATIDVTEQLLGSELRPYAGGDVMGGSGAMNKLQLSAMQQARLEEPLRELGEETTIAEHDLTTGPITYTDDNLNNSLAVYRLKNPLSWHGKEEGSEQVIVDKKFSQVSLVPELAYPFNDSYEEPQKQVSVYLLDDTNNVTELGIMPFEDINGKEVSRTMVFGDEKIVVTAKSDNLTIRVGNIPKHH